MNKIKTRNARLNPGGAYWIRYMIPALIIYCVFMVYPLLDTVRLSLFTGNVANREFVGFSNFIRLFTDEAYISQYLNAFRNTLVFFAIHMLVQNVLGIIFANILTQPKLRGRKIYQAIVFMPVTFAIVSTGFIWSLLLNPIWNEAPLTSIGLESLSQPWLGRESSALIAISLVSSWQWVGIPMMLFVVGLQNINEDLYEAARIDGASSLQTFFRIKIPLLKPVIGIVSLLTFIGNFNAFDIIVTMSDRNGFPGGAADLMGVMLFRVGISGRHPVGIPDPGMGAAIASVTLVFLTMVTLIVLKKTRTKE